MAQGHTFNLHKSESREHPYCIGLWEPSFAAQIANEIPANDGSYGLGAEMRLTRPAMRPAMLKLYRFDNQKKEYWETWKNDDGNYTVHWGELGTRGNFKIIKSSWFSKTEKNLQNEVETLQKQGFHSINYHDHRTLIIEYAIDAMGDTKDIEKRHRLEKRMNEALGWTGLGACDGGSIGSGSMEVCTFVVDFDMAKAVIEQDLAGTEFENYTRIFEE